MIDVCPARKLGRVPPHIVLRVAGDNVTTVSHPSSSRYLSLPYSALRLLPPSFSRFFIGHSVSFFLYEMAFLVFRGSAAETYESAACSISSCSQPITASN